MMDRHLPASRAGSSPAQSGDVVAWMEVLLDRTWMRRMPFRVRAQASVAAELARTAQTAWEARVAWELAGVTLYQAQQVIHPARCPCPLCGSAGPG